jgi:hypothetical protein
MRKDLQTERAYKSVWHLAMFSVGIYELKYRKSALGKVLGAGMALFHLDACIADAMDVPPLSRSLLEKVLDKYGERKSRNPDDMVFGGQASVSRDVGKRKTRLRCL